MTNFGVPPSGIWRCRDGMVDIAAHRPPLEPLRRPGREPEVLADPIYQDRGVRIQLHDLLSELIGTMLGQWNATDFVDSAQTVGLPCALMQTPAQFVRGDQQRSRGFFVASDPDTPGSFEIPGAPFLSSPSITSFRRPAPELGASNRDVYLDELGHAQSELDRWRDDGLV